MLYSIRDNYKWYDVNFESILKEMHRNGFAQEYKIEGVDYIKILHGTKDTLEPLNNLILKRI
jgi:hypothetical protein